MALENNYYNIVGGSKQVSVGIATDAIMKGVHYFAGFELAALAAPSVTYYLFKTGATEVVIDAQGFVTRSGDFNFRIFEDSIISVDGAAIGIQNSNRPLQNEVDFAPTVGFFSGPTITNNGTEMINFPVRATDTVGNKTAQTYNIGGFGKEFILKKNTNYLMCIENNLALSLVSDIAFQVDWHENRKSVGGA